MKINRASSKTVFSSTPTLIICAVNGRLELVSNIAEIVKLINISIQTVTKEWSH